MRPDHTTSTVDGAAEAAGDWADDVFDRPTRSDAKDQGVSALPWRSHRVADGYEASDWDHGAATDLSLEMTRRGVIEKTITICRPHVMAVEDVAVDHPVWRSLPKDRFEVKSGGQIMWVRALLDEISDPPF